MTVHASPLAAVQPDMSLAALLAALAPHDSKSLVFVRDDGRQVQAGYHVTEVKAGSFVTLDCGGNPDAWRETVLQVWDIPASEGRTFMTVGKFRSILARVESKVPLDADARLTIEVSGPGEAMRVHDVAGIAVEGERAIVRLGARPAICKPRHRAAQAQATTCRTTATAGSACCA